MHEEVWLKNNNFYQDDSYENLDNFPYYGFCICIDSAFWADQLLPQLLMEQFITLPLQCRHLEHMHEGVWFQNKVDKMTTMIT